MKLPGITKNKITKYENGENVPHSKNYEVVLVYCNIVNNVRQHDSSLLYIVTNKLFGQLLNISPENVLFSKSYNLESAYIEVWFTDQNCKSLEIEYKINIILVINLRAKYKK